MRLFVAVNRADGEKIVRPNGTMTFQTGDVVIVAKDPIALTRTHEQACGEVLSA